MPLIAQLARKIPASGSYTDAPIGGIHLTDPVTNSILDLESFHEHGYPAAYIKLAKQVTTSNVGKFYPDCGATFPAVLPSSPATNGGTTLVLPTDVLQSQDATLPPGGLMVGFRTGAAKGRWRQITGVSGTFSSTKTVVVNRAWATAEGVPGAGDQFFLAFDASWGKHLIVKVEHSASGGSNTCSWIPVMTDIGRDPLFTTLTDPFVNPDQLLVFANLGIQGYTEETSYYHGQSQTIETKGHWGVMFYLSAAAATHSLWAAIT
jgi:hypothetical protein